MLMPPPSPMPLGNVLDLAVLITYLDSFNQ